MTVIAGAFDAIVNVQGDRIKETRGDLNGRVDILDANVGTRIDDLSGRLEQQIGALGDRLESSFSTANAELGGKIDTINARIDGLENNVTTRLARVGKTVELRLELGPGPCLVERAGQLASAKGWRKRSAVTPTALSSPR